MRGWVTPTTALGIARSLGSVANGVRHQCTTRCPSLKEGLPDCSQCPWERKGHRINLANLLSEHARFAVSLNHAEHLLEQVAGWAEELREHYSQSLSGDDL